MSTLYYDTLPPAETVPNSPLISAPNYQRGLILAPVDNFINFSISDFPLLPNSTPPLPPLNLPIDDTLNFSISGQPNPFYIPNTQTPTCNCEQSSSSCNCPTPTPYKEPTPEERAEFQRIHDEYLTRQIQTHNKKYMYIAGGLIIAFFIFRKK